MSATVDRQAFADDLARAVAITKHAHPKRPHIKITARAGVVSIDATDLRSGLMVSIPATVAHPFEAVVVGSLLAGTLAASKASTVKLEHRNGAAYGNYALIATHDRALAELPGAAVADYSGAATLAATPESKPTKVTPAALIQAMRRVVYAVRRDDNRPGLGNVHVEVDDGRMTVTATDGTRLATCNVAVPAAVGEAWSARIPRDGAGLALANMLHARTLEVSPTAIVARGDDEVFAVLLSDEGFPNWRAAARAPDAARDVIVPVQRRLLAAAVDRLLAVRDGSTGVHAFVHLLVDDLRIELATDVGSGACVVPYHDTVRATDATEITVAVDLRYIDAALSACEGDVVQVSAFNALAPIQIADGDARHVVMAVQPAGVKKIGRR